MNRLLQYFADRKARKAAQFLVQCRIKREKELRNEVARMLREECGLPPHQAFQ